MARYPLILANYRPVESMPAIVDAVEKGGVYSVRLVAALGDLEAAIGAFDDAKVYSSDAEVRDAYAEAVKDARVARFIEQHLFRRGRRGRR